MRSGYSDIGTIIYEGGMISIGIAARPLPKTHVRARPGYPRFHSIRKTLPVLTGDINRSELYEILKTHNSYR